MIYSEFINMAINELGLSKVAFAKEIGVSMTTLYRILNNETLLPSNKILEILSGKGIDTSLLDIDDIYFNYVQEHYHNEYNWVSDIDSNEVELIHNKCRNSFWVSLNKIENHEKLCPYCFVNKIADTENVFAYDDNLNEEDEFDLDFDFDSDFQEWVKDVVVNLPTYGMEIEENTLKAVTDIACSTLVVPSGIKVIEEYALSSVREKDIKTIIIPESVEYIGESAFSDLAINNIILNEGLKEICEYAFSCCTFSEIELPKSVIRIGECAFEFCEELEEIDIPSLVLSIEEYTFNGCLSLRNVYLSEGLDSIGNGAFDDCESLKEIYIPSTVKSIGDFAFCGCKNLRRIVMPENCKIGEHAFLNTNENLIIKYYK